MECVMMVYEKALRGLIALKDAQTPQNTEQINRYKSLLLKHQQIYNTKEAVGIASAPGRVEIIGNHTDHNHGLVLAAAVNMDTVAAFSRRDDLLVNLASEGYEPISLDLSKLTPVMEEAGTSKALIRGVAAGLVARGYKIGGFDAAVTSTVRGGSGLSSSAAFEVMLSSSAIRNHIREAKTFQIPSVLQTGRKYGMQTMDDAIYDLYARGEVTADTALLFAQDRAALSKRII